MITPTPPAKKGSNKSALKLKSPSRESEIPLPESIAILFSEARREYFPTEAQFITEQDAEGDAGVIGGYLERLGCGVTLLPGNADLPERLRQLAPHMVLNLVDSIKGSESLASAIPGVLELLGAVYTGAGILGLSLDTNKFLVKKLLQNNGVPVPNFQLFNSARDFIDPALRFPLISKLNSIHGSVEITRDAVSENEKHLRKRLKYLIRTYKQPVLVEEFISGREITAIVVQEKKKKVYLAEKLFAHPEEKYVFLTFEDQWLADPNTAFHYTRYNDALLKEYAKKAFSVTKMADYGKFDVRLDQSGRYFFIDSNCNPALGPKELDVAISVILDLYDIPFEVLLRRLVSYASRGPARKKARKLPPEYRVVMESLPEGE